MTKIEWAEKSWNPIVGCTPVSEGCRNCYAAFRAHHRLSKNPRTPYYQGLTKETADGRPVYNGRLRVVKHALDRPGEWKTPQKIFPCSMSDLFHEAVPDALLEEIWDVMAYYSWHTYLALTKRAERAAELTQELPFLSNVWLGVSIENQEAAEERIPHLLKSRAAVRWISAEPLLGQLEIERFMDGAYGASLDWVVCGDESGPRRRECDLAWVEDLCDQCVATDTPFFLKQLHIDGKKVSTPELDGRRFTEYPRVA